MILLRYWEPGMAVAAENNQLGCQYRITIDTDTGRVVFTRMVTNKDPEFETMEGSINDDRY
jgi:hypothetical protein